VEAEIPQWKTKQDYFDELRYEMKDFMPYIRFSLMTPETLIDLEDQGFVPVQYLAEAIRSHLLRQLGKPIDESISRFRYRFNQRPEWDPYKLGPGIVLSADLATVTKSSSCSYSTVLAKTGFKTGKHNWEIKLNSSPGCYATIGVATRNFAINGGQLGAVSGFGAGEYSGWGFHLTQGYVGTASATLAETPHTLVGGTIMRLELDLTKHTLSIFTDDSNLPLHTFQNVTSDNELVPALSVCHNSPAESYTLRSLGHG